MLRKIIILLSAILLGVIIGLGAAYLWLPQSTVPETVPLVGGDADAHGCIGSAGYSWCEAQSKCLRVWEEPCTPEDVLRNFLRDHLSELSPEPEVLGGKFYVTALNLIGGDRATVEYEDGHNAWRAAFRYRIAEDVIIEDFHLADASAPSDVEPR